MAPGARTSFGLVTHKKRAVLFGGVMDREGQVRRGRRRGLAGRSRAASRAGELEAAGPSERWRGPSLKHRDLRLHPTTLRAAHAAAAPRRA